MSLMGKGLGAGSYRNDDYEEPPDNGSISFVAQSHLTVKEARSLADIDLGQQLLVQIKLTTQLQDLAMGDKFTPANQKAQTLNSCNQLLKSLVKMKTDLYNAERIRVLEQTLIDTLRDTATEETQAHFLSVYTERLKELEKRDGAQEMESDLLGGGK